MCTLDQVGQLFCIFWLRKDTSLASQFVPGQWTEGMILLEGNAAFFKLLYKCDLICHQIHLTAILLLLIGHDPLDDDLPENNSLSPHAIMKIGEGTQLFKITCFCAWF